MARSQPCHQHAHEQAWLEKDMTVWNQNRETIRQLFLLENRTLAQVKRILESEHGFPEFRLTDYEVALREHFGFRKNLKKEDWLAIGYHRKQRRQKGKASDVYLQGLLIEKPRVDRAVRRSKNDRNLPYRGRRERAHPLPEGITMRTPSPVLPSRHGASGTNTNHTTMTTNILSIRSLGQSVNQVAPGLDILPMNIGMTQRQLHVQVSVEEMRLHLPFNKFAETIKLHYNMDASTSPSPTYTGVHQPSIGSVRLPEHSNHCTNYEAFGGSHQNGTARQTITTNERRHDHLTTRNIAFVGGKFEFDKLMRVFFVLSNKQKIHQHEGVEIIEWIESADLGVLRSLFSLPLSTVAAAWEQLVLISNVLNCQNAFSKLLETGLVIHDGKWLETKAGDILGTAIWLGLRDCVKRLLKNGLSPEGHLKQVGHTPFLGTIINRKDLPYNGERLFVPLEVALLRSDAEIMAELFYYGAPAAWHTTDIIGEILLDRSTDKNHYDMLRCLEVLLDEGVDVDRETYGEMLFSYLQEKSSFHRLGWLPNRTKYLSDVLWCHFAEKTSLRVAFDLISKNSKRINDTLTVPGLYDAASCGCSKLLQYLNSRTTPSGSDRNLLLEITLCQAALRGDMNVSQTLVQVGVDPNVQEIFSQTSQRETWRSYSAEIHFDLADQWVPVFQASKNRDTALLQILFNAGVDCNQHNLLDALLSEGEEQWTNLCAGGHSNVQAVRDPVDNGRPLAPEAVNYMYKFLLTAGFDIRIHGSIAMARAVMRWGRSEPEVASLQCDWLHSKGVNWDAEFEGRNLVHCAVKWGCRFDLVRFFVGRGVKVHSSPCNEGTTMLHDALKEEYSLEVINFLLHQGASIRDRSYHGMPILQSALFRFGLRRVPHPTTALICRRLIEAGATISPRRQSEPEEIEWSSRVLAALIRLSGIEDSFILRLLESDESINLCYDPGCIFRRDAQSPMEAAIERGRLHLARELLQRGRNERNASLILSTALRCSTRLCLSFPDDRPALDFMMFLIKSGADIEELGIQGLNPLHHTAEAGSLNIAGVLLKNGANPNIPIRRVMIGYRHQTLPEEPGRPFFDPANYQYRHPSKGDFGPDEGIVYDESGCPHFMDEDHGPLLSPRSLDLAATHGRLDMVQLLLNAGAISGHPGITPYDGAIESAQFNGHHTIVRLLEEAAVQAKSCENTVPRASWFTMSQLSQADLEGLSTLCRCGWNF